MKKMQRNHFCHLRKRKQNAKKTEHRLLKEASTYHKGRLDLCERPKQNPMQ